MRHGLSLPTVLLMMSLPLLLGLFQIPSCGLNEDDFVQIASDGVDDRLNSYPWAMEQFDGDGDGTPEIYVGTISNALCIQAPGMAYLDELIPGYTFLPPERWQCRNDLWDPNDWLPFYQATFAPCHVFRGTYDESTDTWNWAHAWDPSLTQVTGFRGARVFNDALYLTGNGLYGAHVYKTTDGATFAKASPPGMGVIMGQSGFRGAQVFQDTLCVASDKGSLVFGSTDPSTDPNSWQELCSLGFVASGGGTHEEVYDSGTVTAAAANDLTDDTKSWRPMAYAGSQVRITAGTGAGQSLTILANDQVSLVLAGGWTTVPDATSEYEIFNPAAPDNQNIWQLAVFNDHLYAITYNFETGPEMWKSPAPAPGNWTRVIYGGYGNAGIGFMTVRPFKDHIYVGTVTYPPLFNDVSAIQACEILRADADDNVELVVGKKREAGVVGPDPVRPISGLPRGFGRPANFYSWYMGEYEGWFYVGTCDFSGQAMDVVAELFPDGLPDGLQWIADLLAGPAGFDLWRTKDGVIWVPVTLDGLGEYDNYGVRNLMATQWGFFLGAGNSVDGFQIWLGKN